MPNIPGNPCLLVPTPAALVGITPKLRRLETLPGKYSTLPSPLKSFWITSDKPAIAISQTAINHAAPTVLEYCITSQDICSPGFIEGLTFKILSTNLEVIPFHKSLIDNSYFHDGQSVPKHILFKCLGEGGGNIPTSGDKCELCLWDADGFYLYAINIYNYSLKKTQYLLFDQAMNNMLSNSKAGSPWDPGDINRDVKLLYSPTTGDVGFNLYHEKIPAFGNQHDKIADWFPTYNDILYKSSEAVIKAEAIKLPDGSSALRCQKCRNDYPWAEPKRDGSFVCSSCKTFV